MGKKIIMFDSKITCRGSKRIYSFKVSNADAKQQALSDMRKEAEITGKKNYLDYVILNPKTFATLIPQIELVVLPPICLGQMQIPLSAKEQREDSVNILQNSILHINKALSNITFQIGYGYEVEKAKKEKMILEKRKKSFEERVTYLKNLLSNTREI